ncbi:hypothetical protein pb186bvf_020149 [Paramecium bursaria]
MQKNIFFSVLGFLAMGMVLSFMSLFIFQLKVDKDTIQKIQEHSTLTDNTARDWGVIPGQRKIKMINKFKVFSYENNQFRLSEEQIFSYNQEFKNRTYISNSPGYIKYLPTFWFQEQDPTQGSDVNAINLVAAQSFYKEVNQPNLIKIPRYLNIMINSLKDDFLIYYFTYTIYEFYTKNQRDVQFTIFNPAKLTPEQQDAIWDDQLYGWKNQNTFVAWVRAAFDDDGSVLKDYFQLSDQQINVLIGPASIISKMKRLINTAVSFGIIQQKIGRCKSDMCTNQELAIAQWGFGGLTLQQYIIPVQAQGGSFATLNNSIPATTTDYQFEYFINNNPLQFDEVVKLFNDNIEADNNLFNFNTMQYVTDNIDNPDRVRYKLALFDNDLAIGISNYLKKQMKYINTQNEVMAYECWRFLSSQISESGQLLRNGLYAKALNYKTKGQCIFYITFEGVCDTEYDYTNSTTAALLWVDAYFQEDSTAGSYSKLLTIVDKEILDEYLFGQSEFTKLLSEMKTSFSLQYQCSYPTSCSLNEFIIKQWSSSFITLNLPQSLGFTTQDKVKSISQWDIYLNKKLVPFEYNVVIGSSIDETKAQSLLKYDMGGILGYFTLWNLFDFHFENKELHKDFQVRDKDAKLVAQYVVYQLTNYRYGGIIVSAKPKEYLFDFSNKYTKEKELWPPLEGGINWKSTNVQLIRTNSDEYYNFAGADDFFQLDTGIKDLSKVGTIVKTFMETKLKAKRILYYNDESDFVTQYYYYPYNTQVSGSYGLAFEPQTSKNKLEIFDLDIFKPIQVDYIGSEDYHGFDVRKYEFKDQLVGLQQVEGYPIYVSTGVPNDIACIDIESQTCLKFLEKQSKTIYKIEEKTGIAVDIQKNYIYWLKVDEKSPLLLKPFDKPQYIPVAQRTIKYQYSKSDMNNFFSDIQSLKTQQQAYFWIFLALGLLFFIAFVGFLIYYFKNKAKLVEPVQSRYSSIAAEV